MGTKQNAEIYFHVGLGRTATTFMQRSIFPKFKGIYYVKKNKFKKFDRIISSTQASKYLISYEFYSGKLIEEMKKFSAKYPDTKPILVLRRQDKWISSHYKRSVKKGYPKSLQEYFDLDNDTGYRKVDDLYFYPKIKGLEECFNHKPLVLFHHDLKDNPQQFLQQILDYTGVEETKPISFKPRHISYNNKELRFRQWFAQNSFIDEVNFKGYKFAELRRFYNKMLRYTLLNLAKIIPNPWLSDKPIMSDEYLKRIREVYKDDWEKCLEYARKNNPSANVTT